MPLPVSNFGESIDDDCRVDGIKGRVEDRMLIRAIRQMVFVRLDGCALQLQMCGKEYGPESDLPKN